MWRAHEFLQKFCREMGEVKRCSTSTWNSSSRRRGADEAQDVCAVFQENAQMYGELGDKAVQLFVHYIKAHERHV